ncbi:MAG TPA: sigma-70 family RNA polymerase sigma factor [Phycisphaerae bacterium]|jgi:RNA polymerase sigma factor (sigma-70 family)|nr:sigma-70 family RNA polymerase sigma factor [Phycisphaerae bacterium]
MTTMTTPFPTPFTTALRGQPLPRPELTARQRAAIDSLPVDDREEVIEALTANLDYVKNDLFRRAAAERELFDQGMAIAPASTSWYHPMVDDELIGQSAPSSSLLTTEQEKHLFLRYNYARLRAQAVVKKFKTHPGKGCAREIARWYGRVKATREIITQANLALVLAMAKRTRMSEVDFGELVSEGNMALLRAIEKFDIARGFKFSTYACRAILKAFSRIAMKTSRYRQAFPTEFDPAMERSNYQETKRADVEQDAVEELQRIIGENRADLSDVEKTVIQARFAINRGQDASAMTLEEVGRVIGVTKERVRQIQNKALEKLRATIENEVLVK